jgi:Flp pilus assembly protein TadG
MLPAPAKLPADFAKDENGTIAIVFALTAFIVTLMTGLAIDTGRVYQAESKIAAAADAAALAAAKSLRDGAASDDKARAVANLYFSKNMATLSYAVVTDFEVQIDRDHNTVTVDVRSDVPLTFGRLAGMTKITVPNTASAVFDGKDIELGLQLDVTGSMCQPCTKIDALKDAVSDLLDILLPDGGTNNKVRVGLAPFAGGVNAGDYADAVSNSRSRNGCVFERLSYTDTTTPGDQASDVEPTGLAAFKVRADLTIPHGSSLQDCPSDAKVMAMTNDKAVLKQTVNDWRTSSSTAGHLGAAWAWYLVSPNWSSIWPSASQPVAYGDKKTIKAVVLMTDGIYNTVGGVSGGDTSSRATQSTTIANDTCTAMKAQKIIVYTIGFQAPSAAKTALRDCATDTSKFYDAGSETDLGLAFRAIASELNNLRLTH